MSLLLFHGCYLCHVAFAANFISLRDDVALCSHNLWSVDYANERRMESEYNAAELQVTLEKLELELNNAKEARQQSEQELRELLATQEHSIEQRCHSVQTLLERVRVELESTKEELASSGERVPGLQCTPSKV